MDEKYSIKLFDEYKIRTKWDSEIEDYYYSVIDVIAVLTESKRPRKYWSDLKSKLKHDGSEMSENIGQLKMLSPDGKMRLTDVATTGRKVISRRNSKTPKFLDE